MKTIGIALLAAGLLAGSTGALAAGREQVTLKVSAAAVDFNNSKSVADFRRQMERQIAAACNPGNRVGADLAPDFKCRNELASSLEPGIQHLAERAAQNRYARF